MNYFTLFLANWALLILGIMILTHCSILILAYVANTVDLS